MHAADSVSGGIWDDLPKQVYPLRNIAAIGIYLNHNALKFQYSIGFKMCGILGVACHVIHVLVCRQVLLKLRVPGGGTTVLLI